MRGGAGSTKPGFKNDETYYNDHLVHIVIVSQNCKRAGQTRLNDLRHRTGCAQAPNVVLQ